MIDTQRTSLISMGYEVGHEPGDGWVWTNPRLDSTNTFETEDLAWADAHRDAQDYKLANKMVSVGVVAGDAAIHAHRQRLGITGDPGDQLYHLLTSMLEWSKTNGVNFMETLAMAMVDADLREPSDAFLIKPEPKDLTSLEVPGVVIQSASYCVEVDAPLGSTTEFKVTSDFSQTNKRPAQRTRTSNV